MMTEEVKQGSLEWALVCARAALPGTAVAVLLEDHVRKAETIRVLEADLSNLLGVVGALMDPEGSLDSAGVNPGPEKDELERVYHDLTGTP